MKDINYYFQLFTDIWHLFRHYRSPDGSNAFWEAFIKDSDRLDEKYNCSPLYRNLANAVAEELDRLDKEKRKGDAK